MGMVMMTMPIGFVSAAGFVVDFVSVSVGTHYCYYCSLTTKQWKATMDGKEPVFGTSILLCIQPGQWLLRVVYLLV